MLWIKSLHIIAVVCWFAALFYLPRLFVYHAQAEDEISNERFKIMERKLLNGIGTPSMIAALILGIWLSSYSWDYYQQQWWFWIKVNFVVLLITYHYACIHFYRRFKVDKNTRSHIFFRFFNEAPVFALIACVFLVVIKPQ